MILENKKSGTRITCNQEQYEKLKRGGTSGGWKVINNTEEAQHYDKFSLDFLLDKIIRPAHEDDVDDQIVTDVLEEQIIEEELIKPKKRKSNKT
jgi:hypothetical protein